MSRTFFNFCISFCIYIKIFVYTFVYRIFVLYIQMYIECIFVYRFVYHFYFCLQYITPSAEFKINPAALFVKLHKKKTFFDVHRRFKASFLAVFLCILTNVFVSKIFLIFPVTFCFLNRIYYRVIFEGYFCHVLLSSHALCVLSHSPFEYL